jgi:phosphoglycolate phosphatase-like HAD superfamily hydrolase
MKRALLWDFDGVICDSLDECLLTSYNAFLQYKKGKSGFIRDLGDIPEGIRDFYYHARQYVRRPGEYLILYEALEAEKRLDDYIQFRKLLSEYILSIQGYEQDFFTARERIRKDSLSDWLGLHHEYPWVNDKWEKLKEAFEFYIVSNKDKVSISLILKHIGLNISEENIFGKEFSIEKTAIVEHIVSRGRFRTEEIYFIDDHYSHLMDLAKLGIRLFFATWGYGNAEVSSRDGVVHLQKNIFDRQLLGGVDG